MFKTLSCFEPGLNLNWFYHHDALTVLALRTSNYPKVCLLKNKITTKHPPINTATCAAWRTCLLNRTITNIPPKVSAIREELDKQFLWRSVSPSWPRGERTLIFRWHWFLAPCRVNYRIATMLRPHLLPRSVINFRHFVSTLNQLYLEFIKKMSCLWVALTGLCSNFYKLFYCFRENSRKSLDLH